MSVRLRLLQEEGEMHSGGFSQGKACHGHQKMTTKHIGAGGIC